MEEEENRRELIKKRDLRFLLLSRILNVIESKHSMSIRLKARWPAIVLASLVFWARIHRFGFTWFEPLLAYCVFNCADVVADTKIREAYVTGLFLG